MNVLDVADQQRILTLLGRGWSIRRVSRETGYRHNDPPLRDRSGDPQAQVVGKMYHPGRSAHRPKTAHRAGSAHRLAVTRSSAEPFRAFVETELAKRRNAMAIYQDLVEHHGYTGSYDAVKRLARKLRKREPKVSCRFETEPGQELQVDYGEGGLTRDPRTGKYRRPRLFTLRSATVATHFKKRFGTRRRRFGASSTRKGSRISVASPTRSASIISKRAYSNPTSTTRSSTRSMPRCLSTTALCRYPAGRTHPTSRARSSRRSGTCKRRRSKANASRVSRSTTSTSRAGTNAGRRRASMAPPSDKFAPCSKKSSRSCCRCRRRDSNTIGSVSALFTSTATSRSTAPTTRRRRATLATRYQCTSADCGCVYSSVDAAVHS